MFFTATVKDWKKLLAPDKYKEIIISSLSYLVGAGKIYVYAFVIMPNHIHIIWRIRAGYLLTNIQRDFLKYTAQMIRFDLEQNHKKVLSYFKSERKDRQYQFWQDRSYSNVLHNRKVIEQKIAYIHNNPISKHWKLADFAENYKYSTAQFYAGKVQLWDFVTHYIEHS